MKSYVVLILLTISVVIFSADFVTPSSCPDDVFPCDSEVNFQNRIVKTINSFLDLTDTPSSYAGEGGNCVLVNAGEDGLEFGVCGVGGGSGSSKWLDIGSFIIPNTTFADDIRVNIIEAFDWSNVTISESNIDDLNHDGTGGWVNDSIQTNTSLNVNIDNNLTVDDRIFLSGEDHWFTRGAEELFDGIAQQTFWFHHGEEHEGGTIGFLITAESGGQNKTMFLTQIGRNHSAGVLGNSQMIIPNNLTENLTIISDCFLVANELGKTLRVFCDTSDTGADLIVQHDIQSWGRLFVDEGIRSENEAVFIMNEFDFGISEGDLHLRNSRLEEVGFSIGDNVTLLSADFEDGLSPFILQTTTGNPNEWIDTANADCFDSPCARASKLTPATDSIMEANFTTTDFDSLNLSFRINTTNLDAGDLFNVTVNNNTGSNEVQVHAIADGTDENQLFSVVLPSAMENTTTVSLRYLCNVNVPNEQCLVDDVLIVGTATSDTLTNITRFDTKIKGGSTGSEQIFILYNDTTKQWVFSPDNISFVAVTEVNLTITGVLTLDEESITNWDNVSNFDENVLLTNGSRPLTGNWDAVLNITAQMFKGLFNWTAVSNYLTFDGATLTLNDTKLNEDFNETDLVLAVNDTAKAHTVDTNLSSGGTMTGDLTIQNVTDPTFTVLDETNSVTTIIKSLDTDANIGTTSNHPILFIANNILGFTIETSGSILVDAAKGIQWRDAEIFIFSGEDGQMDIDADVEVEITAPTIELAANIVNITGEVEIHDDLTVEQNITVFQRICFDFDCNASIYSNGTDLIGVG